MKKNPLSVSPLPLALILSLANPFLLTGCATKSRLSVREAQEKASRSVASITNAQKATMAVFKALGHSSPQGNESGQVLVEEWRADNCSEYASSLGISPDESAFDFYHFTHQLENYLCGRMNNAAFTQFLNDTLEESSQRNNQNILLAMKVLELKVLWTDNPYIAFRNYFKYKELNKKIRSAAVESLKNRNDNKSRRNSLIASIFGTSDNPKSLSFEEGLNALRKEAKSKGRIRNAQKRELRAQAKNFSRRYQQQEANELTASLLAGVEDLHINSEGQLAQLVGGEVQEVEIVGAWSPVFCSVSIGFLAGAMFAPKANRLSDRVPVSTTAIVSFGAGTLSAILCVAMLIRK